MKKYYIDGYYNNSTNCGLYELSDFCASIRNTLKTALTEDNWFGALYHALDSNSDYAGYKELSPIVLFSGNNQQAKYKFSPQGFARWLIERGENVAESAIAKNGGSRIQAFLWTPSKPFLKAFEEYIVKQRAAADSASTEA